MVDFWSHCSHRSCCFDPNFPTAVKARETVYWVSERQEEIEKNYIAGARQETEIMRAIISEVTHSMSIISRQPKLTQIRQLDIDNPDRFS